MKTLLTILLMLTVTVGYSQTKKATSKIKTKVTVMHDSLVNDLDTIPVLFKELIIKQDTVYEKWQKGFVVWQTWRKENDNYIGLSSGSWITSSGSYTRPSHYKIEFNYDSSNENKFLYQGFQPVTNKVLTVFKR